MSFPGATVELLDSLFFLIYVLRMIYLILLLFTVLVLIRVRKQSGVVAFFHPYCNAGGGGERVLWCAIRSMQITFPTFRYVVFTGDVGFTKEQILRRARDRFGVEVEAANIEFEYLRSRRLVEADLYPRFTLLLQTIAGFFVGLEALWRLNPAVFVDSMGYPFTLPLFKWIAGSKVVAYVHYPTISCDMISLVERREASFNNSDVIAQSGLLSYAKLVYYRIFAFVYGLAGRAADVVMVNGSWCHGHISRIWGRSSELVFPPCDVTAFLALEQTAEDWLEQDGVLRILSIGQIRPEKNHRLQLEILKEVKDRLQADGNKRTVQLTIAGGCRNTEDQARVESLKLVASDLGVSDNLVWKLNVPYDDLLLLLSQSLISVHTMSNEHFGISVVEGMAAGTIMLAHDSAGPKMDIVVQDPKKKQITGYLAVTIEEYATTILNIASKTRRERDVIRTAARDSVRRFDEETFDRQWIKAIEPLCQNNS